MSLEQLRLGWPLAKISAPRPRALVSRARLLDPLNATAAAGGVALVVAPGGTGKTTLLADWSRHASIPVAWYAVDSTDRDPRRFVSGLCLAIEHVVPGVVGPAVTALSAGAHEAAAIGLVLGAIERRPLALVLDDFQHLDGQPDVTALWDHVLRFRPPTLTIVVVSRSVPLMGFSTLAAFDQLTGVGREELQFDAAEAAALLAAHNLETHNAVRFVSRSGGWAAGVLLLAHAAPDGVRFLRARTEALMEHLGGEILAGLPSNLRTFLRDSAVLGAARPDDADAILGRPDSAELYADAAARGLFLDYDDSLYRYHDLFAEYLVNALKAEDPSRLRAIRRAAAAWWSGCGDLPRALALLAADEDWATLAATLDRERAALWTGGLGSTILMHVERLPEVYHTPRLLAQCGYARSQRGEHARALALADAGMAAAADDDEWLSPALLRVQTLVYAGRDEEVVRSADAALAVAWSATNARAVTFLQELRGTARLRLGRLGEGRDDLMAALAVHEQNRDEDGQARTLFNLATQLIGAGDVRVADEYLARSSALYRRLGHPSVVGELYNSGARLRLVKGDLDGARQDAEQARAAARAGGYPLQECEAIVILADVCADAGNAAEAMRYALEAGEVAARLDLPEMLNGSRRACIAATLLRRDRAGARRLIDEARSLVGAPVDGALLDMLDGILALRARAYRRAAEVLAHAGERLEAFHRPQHAARAYLLCGEALLAFGAIRRAESMLNRMADIVLPLDLEGYLWPLARLTREVISRRRLLRHIRRDTRVVLDRLAGTSIPVSLLHAGGETSAPPLVRLSPFGAGRIEFAGRDIDLSALPPKAREVLFFAGRSAAPLIRDALLDTIWGGDVGGASALWNATRHIRRVFGDDSWGPHDGAYTLRLSVQDDGRAFDAAAAIAVGSGSVAERVAAAVEALDIVGAGGYLEWCDSPWAMSERNRVARRIMKVALTLARLYGEMGRYDEAIAACRRAVAFNPLDEAARLALVRYLITDNQSHAARDEYRAYQRLLRAETGTEPSAELRALALSATDRHARR